MKKLLALAVPVALVALAKTEKGTQLIQAATAKLEGLVETAEAKVAEARRQAGRCCGGACEGQGDSDENTPPENTNAPEPTWTDTPRRTDLRPEADTAEGA